MFDIPTQRYLAAWCRDLGFGNYTSADHKTLRAYVAVALASAIANVRTNFDEVYFVSECGVYLKDLEPKITIRNSFLPCPFCGSPAEYDSQRWERNADMGENGYTGHAVYCSGSDCECTTGVHETKEEAVASWNRRA